MTARVTDTLPSPLAYARGLTATSGNVGRSGKVITWTGAVANSAGLTVTFVTTVSAAISQPTIIVNTAFFDDRQGMISSAVAGVGVNALSVYLPIVRK
jgi:hypothetical protein